MSFYKLNQAKITPCLWSWIWLGLAILIYTPCINLTIGQGNVASDLAAVESLVERHTLFIDNSTFVDTIDKFKHGDHYFSQKSPIFHLLAAVPYQALRLAGFSLARRPVLCLRVLTFFMVVLPMGWLLVLIFSHPWLRRQSLHRRVLLTLGFACGSLMTPFAVTLNHYVLASACLLAAVNALIGDSLAETGAPSRGKRRSECRNNRWLGFTVGFWLAASLACDVPPAFLLGLAVTAVWAWRAPGRLPWLATGAAPLLLLYAALNIQLMGSPLPPNMHEQEMLYYKGSYWSELKAKAEAGEPGYYQVSYPRRLFHATVGHKGIYWMMPLIALATLAALYLARRRAPGWPLALGWALFPLLTIAVTMRWAFDLSGGAYVIRHALAAIPPLYCVLAHPALPSPRPGLRRLVWAGGAMGCLMAWIGVMNPWSHNTLSALPPLENMARFSLTHARFLPASWIGPLIRATSITPDNGWLDLGLAYMELKRLSEAAEALSEAIRLKPSQPLPYYHLGIVQDMMKRPAEAIRTYQTLLRLDPENLGGWNNLGLFALKSGDPQLARQAYDRSLALAPGNASAAWGGLVLEGMAGKPDPDSPRLREALRRHPEDPRIQLLARRWRARSTFAKAR